MSLDYRFGEIKNFKRICFQKGKMNPLSHALIFATIAIGINEITKRNWIKVYARLHLWELVHGAYLSKNGTSVLISAGEVKMHIGLSTNASPLSETGFLRNFSRKLQDIEESIQANRMEKT